MKRIAAVVPAALVLGCSAIPAPSNADPVALQQITGGFTGTIWPAITAYHNSQTQTSPGSVALGQVTDPQLRGQDWAALRTAAGALGRNGEYDSATQTSHQSMGLQLGGVTVNAAAGGTASLDVCYTYTHYWSVGAGNTEQAPGASEATFGLTSQGNTWYLRSITNDHVVPGCPAN